jgi:hypothetical protein
MQVCSGRTAQERSERNGLFQIQKALRPVLISLRVPSLIMKSFTDRVAGLAKNCNRENLARLGAPGIDSPQT